MKFKKAFTISILLMATFWVIQPGFSQVKEERAVSLSGLITTVPKDLKYIGVEEAKVFLSDAKIVDDKGTVLRLSDLKPKLYVNVEGIKNQNGIFAKKITVIRTPKVPKSSFQKP
jgi:hypothetical protein